MATEVVMPRLSDSMEEGTILKWLVDEGGEVKSGEPLVEIETDKNNTTYDAEVDGTLEEIVAKEGATVAVGEPIARVAGADGANGSAPPAEGSEDEGGDGEGPQPEPEPEPAEASPVARRIAEREGVELQAVEGSGPGGRIVKSDVEEAGEAQRSGKGAVDVVELSRLQHNVTRRMAESKATAPDYTLTVEVDMSVAVELPKRLKEVTETPPSVNDMVVKAAALALREHPRVNGAYRDGKWELYGRVNIGIALYAQNAMVIPVIFDADQKSLGQIASDAHAAAEKAADGKLTQPEMSNATFTVASLASYGIDEHTPVITPPQAAILAVGALRKRPLVDQESGRMSARDTVRLTLVADHRILYGAEAADFLARIRELLEKPLALAL